MKVNEMYDKHKCEYAARHTAGVKTRYRGVEPGKTIRITVTNSDNDERSLSVKVIKTFSKYVLCERRGGYRECFLYQDVRL